MHGSFNASGDDLSKYVSASNFSDAKGHWSESNINWVYEKGVVKGISETEFASDANITREQMAAMIMRYADHKGITLPQNNAKKGVIDEKSYFFLCSHYCDNFVI